MSKKKTYTYLIYDESYYKIGMTTNLKKRLNGIYSSNIKAKLLYYLEKNVEKKLHKKFERSRVAREWFNLEPNDLRYFEENFIKNDNIKPSSKKPKRKKSKKLPLTEERIEEIRQNRSDNAIRLGKIKKELTKKEIQSAVENWNFEKEGKITQKKVMVIMGKTISTMKRNWYIVKEIAKDMNTQYKNNC